jgi:hypothetical protein
MNSKCMHCVLEDPGSFGDHSIFLSPFCLEDMLFDNNGGFVYNKSAGLVQWNVVGAFNDWVHPVIECIQ